MSFHPDRKDSFYFCLWVNGLVSPDQGSANFFYRRSENKYYRLCRTDGQIQQFKTAIAA